MRTPLVSPHPVRSTLARAGALVLLIGSTVPSLLAQNTWNGTGVTGGTGGSAWTDGANYAGGTATWNATTDLNLSTITSNTTLSAGAGGNYTVKDILFSSTSSTITAAQTVQVNGNGTSGGTVLTLSGNLSVPSPLNSRAVLGSDLTLNLSNSAHFVRFYQNNSVGQYVANSVTPALVLSSLLTGGGASASIGQFFSAYGWNGTASQSTTPGIVFANNANSFDAKIGGTAGVSGRIAYTTIASSGSNSSLGAGTGANSVIRISSGAILDYIGSGNQTTNRGIDVGGGTPGLNNFASDNASTLTFNGSFTNTATSNATFRLGASQGNTLVFDSVIADGSFLTSVDMRLGSSTYAADGSVVAKTAGGTVILNQANTYSGVTTLSSAGTLRLGHANALGSTANGTTVAAGATLDLNGFAVGAEALTISGSGFNNAGAITNSSATAASLAGNVTLTGSTFIAGAGNLTLNGTIAESGGSRSLTKNGTGTLTLGGVASYTGATTVSAGTLLINGSTSSSSAVTVAGGATLGGNGTVGGATTINGNLRPGNSPGLLSFGSSLTLNSTASTTMEINGTVPGTGYDSINVGAGLAYGGNLTLSFGSTFAAGNYTFNLFDFASQSGNFANVVLGGAYSGSLTRIGAVWSLTQANGLGGNNTWSFSQTTGDLGLAVVPEPQVWALVALSGSAALILRRRRTD